MDRAAAADGDGSRARSRRQGGCRGGQQNAPDHEAAAFEGFCVGGYGARVPDGDDEAGVEHRQGPLHLDHGLREHLEGYVVAHLDPGLEAEAAVVHLVLAAHADAQPRVVGVRGALPELEVAHQLHSGP